MAEYNFDDIIESGGYSSYSPPVADTPQDYSMGGNFGSLYANDPLQAVPAAARRPSFWETLNTPLVEGNYASTPLVQGLRGLANIFPQGRAINEANMAQEQQIFAQQQAQRQQRAQVQQAERQALMQGFDILNHIDKLGPAAQKSAFDLLGKKMSAFTGQENSATLDLFRKSKDEEREKLKQIYKSYFEQTPSAGIKDVDSFTELLLTNPEQANKFLEGGLAREKFEQQKKSEAALLEALGSGQAPGVEGAAPPPSQVPQQQLPPSGRQAQFDSQVDSIGKAMGASDDTIRKVKASGAIETVGYDSNATSRKGAQGVLQFMPDTARQYGVKDPRDDAQAIAGAIRYYQFLEKKFPGKPELQFASYNAGEGRVQGASGIPNIKETQDYVQKAMKRYGSPSTQSVAQGANSAEVATLGRLKEKQTKLDTLIERMTPLSVNNPNVKGLVDQFQQERKYVQDEIRRIEDQYDKNKPDEDTRIAARTLFGDIPWAQLDKEQKKAAIALSPELAAQTAADKAGRVAGAESSVKEKVAKAGVARQTLPDHEKYRGRKGETLSAGATREEVAEADKEWQRDHPGENYWVKTQKLEGELRDKVKTSTLIVRNLQKIADRYGDISTGPIENRIEKLKEAYGGDVTSESVAQRTILQFINNELGRAGAGLTQTPQEIERIQASLPDPNLPSKVFRVRLNTALEYLHESHSLYLQGLEEDGYTGLKPYSTDAPRFVPGNEDKKDTKTSEPVNGKRPNRLKDF